MQLRPRPSRFSIPDFQPDFVTDSDAEEAFSFLLDRAAEFVSCQGGVVSEDLLISHMFGTVKSPAIWRPLFLRVMHQSRDLRRRIDGSWGFITVGQDQGHLVARFVAIDVETTGLKPGSHRIIEVGLVRFEDGLQTSAFGSLCNPGQRIPAFITKLTSIRNEDVVDAPEFGEIATEVLEFIGDDLVVGHNVGFDTRFINAELRRAGYERLVNDSIDVMTLAPKLLTQLRRPSLDKVAVALGLSPRKIHRAVGDADLAARAMVVLARIAGDQGIGSIDQLRGASWSEASHIKQGVEQASSLMDKQLLEDVPQTPGVYVMRDELGRVIYVGKSKHLRNRVRSYFSQPLGYTRKMDGLAETVRTIRCEQTGTELEALLLEAQLIRRYQPRFNKALRNHEQYPYIRVDVSSPWPRVSMTSSNKDDGSLYFGPYRNRSSAKKVVELLAELFPVRTCPRSFKSAKSYGSPCIRLDLGQCAGPCVGKADRGVYRKHIDAIIRFLDGEDGILLERIHNELEIAAADQDFERARSLRNAIQTLSTISAEWRGLRNLASRGDFAVILPEPHLHGANVLLIAEGRIWATIGIGRDESFASFVRRFEAAISRRLGRQGRIAPVDRHNVDEHAILYRWLDKYPGHPAVVYPGDNGRLDALTVHQCAQSLTADDFEQWQPEDTESEQEDARKTQDAMRGMPAHLLVPTRGSFSDGASEAR